MKLIAKELAGTVSPRTVSPGMPLILYVPFWSKCSGLTRSTASPIAKPVNDWTIEKVIKDAPPTPRTQGTVPLDRSWLLIITEIRHLSSSFYLCLFFA